MLASETSSIAVVVMLTQTHEAGREKCFQYFPLDATASPLLISPDPEIPDDFQGEIVLESVHEHPDSSIAIRRMNMRTKTTKSEEGKEDDWTEKTVYHLLFSGWPDFLVPEGNDRTALLHLVDLSAKLNADATAPQSSSFEMYEKGARRAEQHPRELNPRIIHCSAGVGRSGTFIALDYLLGLLEAGELDEVSVGSDPIAETVDKLRQQRMMMVQGEGQFMFLYEVLKEAWIKRWQEKEKQG